MSQDKTGNKHDEGPDCQGDAEITAKVSDRDDKDNSRSESYSFNDFVGSRLANGHVLYALRSRCDVYGG